jgi:transcriptional regulator with XRE-family HTH domain
MTQSELAEATGLSTNYISNIENNHSIPSISTLVKVCDAIDTTPNYLLLGILRGHEEDLCYQISERVKICDRQKLNLVKNFITWVIDEDI